MNRYASLANGIVTNVVIADESFALANDMVACGDAAPGWLYAGGVFSAPPPDLVVLAAAIRHERNVKLASSDWTQVADAPVDKVAWANYRQALRDLTRQSDFPLFVTWPTEPS